MNEPRGYLFRNIGSKGGWSFAEGPPYEGADKDWEVVRLYETGPLTPEEAEQLLDHLPPTSELTSLRYIELMLKLNAIAGRNP